MEHKHSWMRLGSILWTHQLGMHACPAHPVEIQVQALCKWHLELGWLDGNLRIEGVHFRQASIPKGVEIGRAGIDPLISTQLLEREIKGQWHRSSFRMCWIRLTGTRRCQRRRRERKHAR
jgi:hypothetical protein